MSITLRTALKKLRKAEEEIEWLKTRTFDQALWRRFAKQAAASSRAAVKASLKDSGRNAALEEAARVADLEVDGRAANIAESIRCLKKQGCAR